MILLKEQEIEDLQKEASRKQEPKPVCRGRTAERA